MKLRTLRPAATMSTRDNASSAVTSPLRRRLCPRSPTAVRLAALTCSIKFAAVVRQAGTSPESTVAATQSAAANSRTTRLISMGASPGA